MAIMGMFGKKDKARDAVPPPKIDAPPPAAPPSPPPVAPAPFMPEPTIPGSAPPAPQAETKPIDLDIPEIPPIEDLDLPPPPNYPGTGPKPEGLAQPTPTPSHETYVSGEPFSIPDAPEVKPEPRHERPRPVLRRVFTDAGPSKRDIIERVERRPAPKSPVYVPVDDYKAVIDGTDHIKANLKEVSELLGRMNELKNEEDKEFEKWRTELEDIQRKLMYVDKIIFESG